ncbi:MAG: hypothetical protein ACFFC6_06650 [Promethearchaeota archaeon]
MRSYERLSEEEIKSVETTIEDLIGSNITNIFEGKQFVKIKNNRNEIYVISQKDLFLLDHISSQNLEDNFSIEHAGIKLGFFIHNKFLIGIESLTFLAPYTRKKIHLDVNNTKRFIFGKDVEMDTVALQKKIKNLNINTLIMVFSKTDIPLGYAKVISNGVKLWLQNIVDIGIFLRSEKSAF